MDNILGLGQLVGVAQQAQTAHLVEVHGAQLPVVQQAHHLRARRPRSLMLGVRLGYHSCGQSRCRTVC